MVNRNLIRSLEDDDIQSTFDSLFPSDVEDFDSSIYTTTDENGDEADFDINKIVEGRIVRIEDDMVLVDVGFKSEGSIPLSEWDGLSEPPQVGDSVHVMIEDLEDEHGAAEDPHGLIVLSKRKADNIRLWEDLMSNVQEGDVVTGKVTRKIKGGLLVDIGVPVFLPASQVDIRRPGDIGDYIGRVVQCEILKIDHARRNIVVSRRSLIEKEREIVRETLLQELENEIGRAHV